LLSAVDGGEGDGMEADAMNAPKLVVKLLSAVEGGVGRMMGMIMALEALLTSTTAFLASSSSCLVHCGDNPAAPSAAKAL